jgi:hypothetical protein
MTGLFGKCPLKKSSLMETFFEHEWYHPDRQKQFYQQIKKDICEEDALESLKNHGSFIIPFFYKD